MSDASSRHSPLRPEIQLKGSRPPPLRLSKESRKIRKQNVAPPPAAAEAKSHHHPPPPPPPPVIIYTESPKVIHVDPNEFMSVVQRLTGSNPSSSSTLNTPPPPSSAGGGGVSPAPQLAGVPEWRETQFFDGGGDEMPQNLLWDETDSNPLSYLNTGLHGNMSSSNVLVLDVFNYMCDII